MGPGKSPTQWDQETRVSSEGGGERGGKHAKHEPANIIKMHACSVPWEMIPAPLPWGQAETPCTPFLVRHSDSAVQARK